MARGETDGSTAPLPLELAAAPGLELVPLGAEREVIRLHDRLEGQPHPPQELGAEEAVLVEHGDDELVGDVADEEPELLVPHGAEAPLHHRGRPRAAPPQLQPHVGVAGAVEVDRRQAPRLHHVHAQQHRRVVVAGLRATGRACRRRRPRHLWGLARRDERVRRCSVRTGEIEQWRAICGLHGIGDSDEAKGGGLPAAV